MNGEPRTLAEWHEVLANSARVPPESSDYAEAQQVKRLALARIGDLERRGNIADAPLDPNAVVSALAGTAQTASLGIGEPLSGLGSALTGGSFREGAQRYRSGLERLTEAHPYAEAAGESAGLIGPGAVSALRGAAVPVAEDVLRGTLARIGRGAGTGAAIGGLAGFSTGGSDPGDLRERLATAGKGAILGGALGATLSGAGTRAQSQSLDRSIARQEAAARLLKEQEQARLYGTRADIAERQLSRPVPGSPEWRAAKLAEFTTRGQNLAPEVVARPAETAQPSRTPIRAVVRDPEGIPGFIRRQLAPQPAAPDVLRTALVQQLAERPVAVRAARGRITPARSPGTVGSGFGPAGGGAVSTRSPYAALRQFAATPDPMLKGVLGAQVRAMQLLKGPTTQAAQAELATLLRQVPPGGLQFLTRSATPEWRTLLSGAESTP